MKHFLGALVVLLGLTGLAQAQLARAELDKVGINAKPGAMVPEDAVFRTIDGASMSMADALAGRPAILVFADYTCRTLCGTTIAMVSDALDHSGLTAGKDFDLVVVGMDPKDSSEDAAAMRAHYVDSGMVGSSTRFLLGNHAAVDRTTSALGYRYAYDKQADQFAHPTGAYVLSPTGAVSQLLTTIGITPQTMRLALVEAGNGNIGSFSDYVRLLCYCYDPATGKYSSAILGWLRGLGFATVAALGLAILFMARRHKGGNPFGGSGGAA